MTITLLAASLAVGNITRDTGPACAHLTAPVGIVQRSVANGAMTSGSANLDSATAAWVAATDIGRLVCVRGAGAAGGLLCANILSRTSASRVVLSAAASTSVTNAVVQVLAYTEYTTAAIASGQTMLTVTGATFTAGDQIGSYVGRRIAVGGAGAGGAMLVTTIAQVIGDAQLQLAAAAGTTVSGQTTRIARTTTVRTTTSEMAEAVTEADLVAALKVWGKLASGDGKTLAQMEGHTVVAAVP